MKLSTTLFLTLIPFITFSQNIIRGTVLDEIGPLSGANIAIKNTRVGVVSDSIGNYEIEVKKTDTLLVSYLGYDSESVIVANSKYPKTILKGNIVLNEVKLVAFSRHYCKITCCGISIKYNNEKNFKSNIITEKLYPNPSRNGLFQLKLLNDFNKVEIQVYNISGKFLKHFESKLIQRHIDIDLSQYPKGIYIINIIVDGKQLVSKKAIIG